MSLGFGVWGLGFRQELRVRTWIVVCYRIFVAVVIMMIFIKGLGFKV